MQKTIGIYWNPLDAYDGGETGAGGGPLRLFKRVVRYKANPRTVEYMRALFLEKHPDGEFLDVYKRSDWLEFVTGADRVVLLYPDSTGLLFGGVERRVFRRVKTGAAVFALNGRKREFELDAAALGALRLRRFLERTMLFEALLSVAFIAATPALVVYDFVRGHR